MSIKSVEPALLGADLEDVTHGCKHCGTELIRTVMPQTLAAPAVATDSRVAHPIKRAHVA